MTNPVLLLAAIYYKLVRSEQEVNIKNVKITEMYSPKRYPLPTAAMASYKLALVRGCGFKTDIKEPSLLLCWGETW